MIYLLLVFAILLTACRKDNVNTVQVVPEPNMLTVLHKDHTSEVGKAKWVCRCECGQLVSVLSESLRNGSTKSCGCLVRRLTHDLTGKEFGHLLVLERTYDRRYVSKDTRWKCLCQNCGRTVSVSSRQLRTGNPYGHCKCTRYKK